MVTSRPASNSLHALAAHLQELDIRHRHLFSATTRSRSTDFSQQPRPLNSRPASSNPPTYATVTQCQSPGDPIDTSNIRQPTDKETGSNFQCHKPGHCIQECSEPDTRPNSIQRKDSDARKYRLQRISLCSPSPPQSPTNRYAILQSDTPQNSTYIRPPTPAYPPTTESENGVGL